MYSLTPPFGAANVKFAYQLHYHIGFRTRRAVPVFGAARCAHCLENSIAEICRRNEYHLLESEIKPSWLRLLVSLRPEHSPAAIVRTIKANSSRSLLGALPEIEIRIGRRALWSRGYYLRGVGDVTDETVYRYVARQREHHELELRNSRELASFSHAEPERYFRLRPRAHCVAEYNCHLVFASVGHLPAIKDSWGDPLLTYIGTIAAKKRFEPISVSILEDHVHLFVALRPAQCPRDVALAIMNNTCYWLGGRNAAAAGFRNVPAFWTPSAFIRTAGAATTNQVRAFLGRGGGRRGVPW